MLGGHMMIKKQYNKMDWSQCNLETATYIGNPNNYTEFELVSDERPILEENIKNMTVNGIVQSTNL